MKYLPLLVFLAGIVLSVAVLVILDAPGSRAVGSEFIFVLGLFTYLALMGWLGRLVAVIDRRNLGMFLSFILGPIGVVVAALLGSES